ncbi:MAG: Crp/Fnr family transcriptional regulator, partial [Bacillota bacterium]
LNYLKELVLFSEMNEDELLEINNLIKTVTYPGGYTLFFQGDEGKKVFFLKEGKVKIVKTAEDGSEQILEILQSGDVFGEVVLFGINHYPATARTMEDIKVNYLNRDDFKEYFNKNPQIAWGMLKVMAQKLAKAQHRVENLGLRNTKGRVARLIMDLLDDFGNKEDEFVLDISQSDLANFIGTSRETVSRTLSEFRKKDLLKMTDNKIIIKDLNGLKNYL